MTEFDRLVDRAVKRDLADLVLKDFDVTIANRRSKVSAFEAKAWLRERLVDVIGSEMADIHAQSLRREAV